MTYLDKQSPKPILLIRFPKSEHSMERMVQFYENVDKKVGADYYVLGVVESTAQEMKMEFINVIDATETDLESLKSELKELFLTTIESD